MFEGSEETFLVLQDTLLSGITDVSFSTSVDEEAVNLLSNRGINRKVNKAASIDCSISKLYINRDFIQELTGDTNLSGQFIYGSNALDFNDAVITNYTMSITPEDVPKSSVKLKIFGDLTPTTNIRKDTASGDYEIKNLKVSSISLNMDGKSSAITDFSYSIDFDAKPTYEIESTKSSSVKILNPVRYSSSAKIEMIEQEFENVTGLIEKSQNRTISFSITDEEPTVLNTYEVPNASLQSQEISINAGDTVSLSLGYVGYSFLPI